MCALNGLDEALDVGDDSQEANVEDRAMLKPEPNTANVKDRAMLLAADSRAQDPAMLLAADKRSQAQGLPEGLGQVWNDLGSPVVLIDHHQFETDETWARFEKDTNVHRRRGMKNLIELRRWRGMMDLIELGDYPLRAPNNFDLKAVEWRGMKDLIELGDYPLRAPNNFDLKVPRPALLASATHSGPEKNVLGDFSLRAPNNFDLKDPRPALLASATRELASAVTRALKSLPAGLFHAGPITGVDWAGVPVREAGPITGVDWAGVPVRQAPGGEAAQVAAVMGGRFGYKPEVLFAYALSPEDEARWDMALLSLHQSLDPLSIKPTFHFFLGWGPLFGKVDYFLRQYSGKPPTPQYVK
ncbi:hypothetical protein T484DRAFT_1850805 [Baffinella frigidus]|nr:hypothetical protein T484DRAFT_1850805 [Cryptophyta sp. CCMP2293]